MAAMPDGSEAGMSRGDAWYNLMELLGGFTKHWLLVLSAPEALQARSYPNQNGPRLPWGDLEKRSSRLKLGLQMESEKTNRILAVTPP